jgi:hypothetical protein
MAAQKAAHLAILLTWPTVIVTSLSGTVVKDLMEVDGVGPAHGRDDGAQGVPLWFLVSYSKAYCLAVAVLRTSGIPVGATLLAYSSSIMVGPFGAMTSIR